MQTANPNNFFRSDAAHAQEERKAAKAGNKHGNPLQTKSKILAAIADPRHPSDGIFLAESAGRIRRLNVNTHETRTVYQGPKAPVTCVAVGSHGTDLVFGGCWDKDIWVWDMETGDLKSKLSGHSDFVKTVAYTTISGKPVLISGGADKKILVWDVESGRRLHTLQDASTTMLAVQHIAIDPVLSTADEAVFASASSDPHIRRWKATLDGAEQLAESFKDRPDTERLTIEEHETSVYRLVYDSLDDGDLWTASADGTAKCLSRAANFVTGDEFAHGDYVRAVVVTEDWVVTAGRDEDIKVWDRATGKLYAVLEGHFEEVTDLVLLRDAGGRALRIASVGIDRTVRTWPLLKTEIDDVVDKAKEAAKPKEEEAPQQGLMTAEEEAELAELMDD